MIKRILIGLAILVVAGASAFGALYFVKQANHKTVAVKPSTSKPKTVLDFSKDYGACTMVDVTAIKTALGSVASSIQAAQNEGIVKNIYIGDSVKNITSDSQTCVFAFKSGGTINNGFNSVNALSITRTSYTNDGGPKTLIAQFKSDPANDEIDTIGDVSFYTSSTNAKGPGATYIFDLIVFKSNTSTDYTIRQPADTATFTADTAKTALLSLTKSTKP